MDCNEIPVDWPPLIADQLALDLLNTVVQQDGAPVEHLVDDAAAARWLARATGAAVLSPAPSGLARKARGLREAVRAVVEARKAGRPADLGELNRLLARVPSHWTLHGGRDGIRVHRSALGAAAWRPLAPLAEAAVALLADGDFDLVRQCEHPLCTLWFYDRTKSHKRRWCSMALCGNRHKVSEFRKRRQASAE
ncbi:CGNR zinc finger domain-containing protein [Sorangium sp. So ce131]|uniref:CGNR zinc finger domain-containing protein n=1 Tax=Sorangium sp. So ce131 TaxID=3133282 RepID=UPI003F5DB29E